MKRSLKYRALVAAKVLADSLVVAVALYLAFFIRFDGAIPEDQARDGRFFLPILVVLRILALAVVTRYRLQWRSTSLTTFWSLLQAVIAGSAAFVAMVAILHGPGFPRGALLVEGFITLNFWLGLRLAARLAWNRLTLFRRGQCDGRRVLVVGAGDAGARIVHSMKQDHLAGLQPVGFVDDDPLKAHRLIHGVKVLGRLADIASVAETVRADQILIAIPSLPGPQVSEIVRECANARGELTILPSLPEIVSSASVSSRLIRRVSVEDLLGRSPVRVNVEEIAAYVSNQRVLVTGAGGSIGGELCRQIAGLNPACLILMGHGENSVFWIERELRRDFGLEALPVIADIKDRRRLNEVFSNFQPTVVFHAAAHKHVPLMELNPGEAAKNNIFGTMKLAETAIHHRVKRFVMISTDKAVNPTSVMGASKRVAEMIVQSLAQRIEAAHAGDGIGPTWGFDGVQPKDAVTRFAAVRFGNVLGSRGSVVPAMQEQIARGGPVTVTHPEMVRFFMTIPEAVQLVLQAGSMGRNGEVFVLDMGRPVRIMDLAWNLIRLSGFVPNVDIPIQVTGIRPGEKLYEEMMTPGERERTTSHEKIFTATPARISHERLEEQLQGLARAVQDADAVGIRDMLGEIVPSFRNGRVTPPDGYGASAMETPERLTMLRDIGQAGPGPATDPFPAADDDAAPVR